MPLGSFTVFLLLQFQDFISIQSKQSLKSSKAAIVPMLLSGRHEHSALQLRSVSCKSFGITYCSARLNDFLIGPTCTTLFRWVVFTNHAVPSSSTISLAIVLPLSRSLYRDGSHLRKHLVSIARSSLAACDGPVRPKHFVLMTLRVVTTSGNRIPAILHRRSIRQNAQPPRVFFRFQLALNTSCSFVRCHICRCAADL